MAKKMIESNFRVVVTPRRLGDFGSIRMSDSFVCSDPEKAAKRYRERCEEIKAQIKRHVDEVECVEIEMDKDPVCQYCGEPWTTDSDTYNDGCCEKDEQANSIVA